MNGDPGAFNQRACGKPVKGNGLLDWMCEIAQGHAGPCMSVSSPLSMTNRKAWEAAQQREASIAYPALSTPMPPPPPPPGKRWDADMAGMKLVDDVQRTPIVAVVSPSQTLRHPSLHDRLQSLVDRDPNLLPPAVKAWVGASEAESSLACLYAVASQEFARGATAISLTQDELIALIPPSLLALMREAQNR